MGLFMVMFWCAFSHEEFFAAIPVVPGSAYLIPD